MAMYATCSHAWVGHPGNQFQHLELRQGALFAVEQVQREEQHPGEHTVATPRRGEGLSLSGDELVVLEVRRTPHNIDLVSQFRCSMIKSRRLPVGRDVPVRGIHMICRLGTM